MKVLFLGANKSTILFSITQFHNEFEKNEIEYTIGLNPRFLQVKTLNFYGGRYFNNVILNFSRLLLKVAWYSLVAIKYDIVFMHQYFYHPYRKPYLELLVRLFSKKFIFYYFDPIWNNAQTTDRALEDKLARILKASDHVIVANHYLADFASDYNENVSVLPMTINLEKYAPPANYRRNNKVVFGFCGAPYNYIYMKVLIPVFEYFKTGAFNVEFRAVSGKPLPDYLKGYGIKHVKWTPENEIEEIQKIDVGLVPLPDCDWTRGKFSIKLIQHMAVGSPVICSNVGVNLEVIKDDYNGYVVSGSNSWIEKIKLLSEDDVLRNRLAKNALCDAKYKYSHKHNADLYVQIFNRVINE